MPKPLPHAPIALDSHDCQPLTSSLSPQLHHVAGSHRGKPRSRVRLVRTTLLLLLSSFPGVLGGNAGFNPAVLGFWLECSQWGALRASSLLSQCRRNPSGYLLSGRISFRIQEQSVYSEGID